jgi:positive regulator of sigma E activity
MEETLTQCEAYVVALTNDNKVWVEVPAKPSTCDHCPNPAGCRTSLLSQAHQPHRYLMSNTLDLHVGDRVSMAVSESTILRAALESYVIPLILTISGAVVGQWLADDGMAALGALTGLVLGFLLLRLRHRGECFHKEHHLANNLFSLQKLH